MTNFLYNTDRSDLPNYRFRSQDILINDEADKHVTLPIAVFKNTLRIEQVGSNTPVGFFVIGSDAQANMLYSMQDDELICMLRIDGKVGESYIIQGLTYEPISAAGIPDELTTAAILDDVIHLLETRTVVKKSKHPKQKHHMDFDATAESDVHRIEEEIHLVVAKSDRYVEPKFGPFYASGFSISSHGRELDPSEYKLRGIRCDKISISECATVVYTNIELLNQKLTMVNLTYQATGGTVHPPARNMITTLTKTIRDRVVFKDALRSEPIIKSLESRVMALEAEKQMLNYIFRVPDEEEQWYSIGVLKSTDTQSFDTSLIKLSLPHVDTAFVLLLRSDYGDTPSFKIDTISTESISTGKRTSKLTSIDEYLTKFRLVKCATFELGVLQVSHMADSTTPFEFTIELLDPTFIRNNLFLSTCSHVANTKSIPMLGTIAQLEDCSVHVSVVGRIGGYALWSGRTPLGAIQTLAMIMVSSEFNLTDIGNIKFEITPSDGNPMEVEFASSVTDNKMTGIETIPNVGMFGFQLYFLNNVLILDASMVYEAGADACMVTNVNVYF